MEPQRASLPMLHRFLGIGLLTLSVLAIALKVSNVIPMIPSDDVSAIIGFVFAGITGALVVAALAGVRPRVPERAPGQSVDTFWATPAIATRILLVWFVLEGAGIFSLVGYFVTGAPVVAGFAGLAIAVFYWCGPDSFAKP